MQDYFRKTLIVGALFILGITKSKAQTEYIVTVDPINGHINKIDSIPGVTWLYGGYTAAYCEYNHHYTFRGWKDNVPDPIYLFTLDAIDGHILTRPVFSANKVFFAMQYSRNSNSLYGMFRDSNVVTPYLASIAPSNGTYSIIRSFSMLESVIQFIVDDEHNRFFIYGSSSVSNNRKLLVVDMVTANIISEVNFESVIAMVYNKSLNTIYGISVDYSGLQTERFRLCTVDFAAGTYQNVGLIPNIAVIYGNETIDENNGRYFFAGSEFNDTTDYLYTIDITTGAIIQKVSIPVSAVITRDNLSCFRYDNILNRLFALYWESHTSPIASNDVDSSCQLNQLMKIYANSLSNRLIIDKENTICKVSLNIYNIQGQLMISGKIIDDGHNEIQLLNFSKGVYIYQFISEGKIKLTGQFAYP